ncbi:unnamed protein product [Calicophoron daubneyi]|uniref:Arrestin-like N-terminal domain-containing protein n=1 Tax=Calicophoron daubneyi TaxID=300641 RepID=A0AAV2TCZ2_CALDB
MRELRVRIILDRASPSVYRSGEVVAGQVQLECDNVISVKVLQIELLGRTVVVAPCKDSEKRSKWWTKERKALHRTLFPYLGSGCIISQLDRVNDANPLLLASATKLTLEPRTVQNCLTPQYRTVNEEIKCANISILLGRTTPGSCELVERGRHFYGFRFSLPESSPSTFTGARGSTEYRLKVCLQLTNSHRVHSVAGFKVIKDLVLDPSKDIPSTLACPPISRHFISGFDMFSSTGAVSPLVTMARQQKSRDKIYCEDNADDPSDYGSCSHSRSLNSYNSLPFTTFKSFTHKKLCLSRIFFRSRGQSDEKYYSHSLRLKHPQGTHLPNESLINLQTSKENKADLSRKWWECLMRAENFPSRSGEPTTTATIVRCVDHPFVLPATWFSRSHTSEYDTYPRSSPGAQTGYAVSCRLTVSRRQVAPGESVSARLTLLVEDPFALILARSSTSHPNELQWCAQLCSSTSRCSKRLWSPLAKAFVSYFLEDSFKRSLSINSDSSPRIWWKGIVKQPYRIFFVLRQLITYRDWTNHVVCEEERDIYSGEMERTTCSESHLLRVVLEHVCHIPPTSPSSVSNCSSIDISYSVGVTYFKLKRLKHLWIADGWKVVYDKSPKPTTKGIEKVYVPNPFGVETRRLRIANSVMSRVCRQSTSKGTLCWRNYRQLQLSIPVTIGTVNHVTSVHQTYRTACYSEILPAVSGATSHPCLPSKGCLGTQKSTTVPGYKYYNQKWPNSVEKGSLPPAHIYYRPSRGVHHCDVDMVDQYENLLGFTPDCPTEASREASECDKTSGSEESGKNNPEEEAACEIKANTMEKGAYGSENLDGKPRVIRFLLSANKDVQV